MESQFKKWKKSNRLIFFLFESVCTCNIIVPNDNNCILYFVFCHCSIVRWLILLFVGCLCRPYIIKIFPFRFTLFYLVFDVLSHRYSFSWRYFSCCFIARYSKLNHFLFIFLLNEIWFRVSEMHVNKREKKNTKNDYVHWKCREKR